MSLRRLLLRTYWWMERGIVPGLEYSQHRYEEHLRSWIRDGVRWLDVGCGRRLLPAWRQEGERELVARAKRLVGVDLDMGSLLDNDTLHDRVFGAVDRLPFASSSFDVVTANMVVEHLDDPQRAFTEVARVLKDGGLFLFHTPNAAGFPTSLARLLPDAIKAPLARVLDSRPAKDVFPTWYRCNSSGSIKRVAASSGFSVVQLSLVSTTAVFSVIPPLAAVELMWIRFVQAAGRSEMRSNIIAVLQKT